MKIQYVLYFICLGWTQSWYNHPEINWETIETEHFLIHFHEETRRSAQEAAAVAENIYEPITTLYEFEPDSKVNIIIKDTDDYSNGAAYYYDNKIEIWALPLDFDLRGAHRWINNVITHEFIHIIQIGASMKYSRRYPATFIQAMSYEDEVREDVLYGYPNTLISYPIPGVSVPPWLAEGSAQYMLPSLKYDYWDSHRDMIVRDRIFNNNLLTFDEMNTFGKKGIGNESIYNQGFLFVSWLVEKYGIKVLHSISKELSNPLQYSISRAIESATNVSGYMLYNQWVEELEQYYTKSMKKQINEYNISRKILISDGTTNIHPSWSSNGNSFIYLSNQENDYFGQTDLFIYNLDDSTSEKISNSVHTKPIWINDSLLVYVKRSKPNKWGSKYFDLYQYNLKNKEEQRKTFSSRMMSPAYNKKLNKIASISTYDGTSNIFLSTNDFINSDTIVFKKLTNFNNGMQLLSLSWVGDSLLVDGYLNHGRKIYSVNLNSGDINLLSSELWDSRNPELIKNGMIYSSDKSGIYNLIEEKNGEIRVLTNVIGGAFMPSVSDEGKILYSLYENGSYKIALIDNIQYKDENLVGYGKDVYKNRPNVEILFGEEIESRPYDEELSQMAIIPKLMFDYSTFKPGIYFYSDEIINRYSIFGGFSFNSLKDLDLFLLLEFKKYLTTFYSNLFWVTRHRNASDSNPFYYPRANELQVENIKIKNDLTFFLFSGDIGSRINFKGNKFWFEYNYTNYREHVSQNVSQIIEYNGIIDTNQFNGEIAFDYFRGHALTLKYKLNTEKPAYLRNMLPGNGWNIESNLSYEWNNFMDGFAVSEEYSTFGANFTSYNTFRITAMMQRFLTLNKAKKITSTFSAFGGALSNPSIDDFFYFFGGGMPGIKGYTFYEQSLTGPYLLIGTSKIRMPIFLGKNIVLGHINFQNLSIGGVLQLGGAMDAINFKQFIDEKLYKISGGLELRGSGFSFFSYPTAVSYEYHNPITDFEKKGNHYLTILFDF